MAVSTRIEVDIVSKQNREVLFPPLNAKFRSEIRTDHVTGVRRIPSVLTQIGGVLPGIRVVVDTKKREAEVIDLMHDPENAELTERLKAAMKAATQDMPRDIATGGTFTHFSKDPRRTFKLDGDLPYNLATWLYWLRRLLDTGKVRVHKGELPTMEEIRQMGDIFLSQNYNITPKEGKRPFNILYQDDQPKVAAGA